MNYIGNIEMCEVSAAIRESYGLYTQVRSVKW